MLLFTDDYTRWRTILYMRTKSETVDKVLGYPRSYDEAIKSADGYKWQRAAEEEYQSLVSNGTWTLCERPVGVNIIGSKWIFKTKRDENGKVTR